MMPCTKDAAEDRWVKNIAQGLSPSPFFAFSRQMMPLTCSIDARITPPIGKASMLVSFIEIRSMRSWTRARVFKHHPTIRLIGDGGVFTQAFDQFGF